MAYDKTNVNTIVQDLDELRYLMAAIIDVLQTGIPTSAPVGGATEAKQDDQLTLATSLNSYVDGLEALITTLNGKLDTINTSLGTIDGHVDGLEAGVGAVADAAVTNPASSASLIALAKGWLTKAAVYFPAALGQTTKSASLAVVVASDDDLQAKLGIVTETAPGTDTASSGLNGRLQRTAQRLTSLIALFPSAIGRTTSAGSLSVVQASDDAIMGIVTETAPATDTASSGLNGRLQRIAQRVTSLIALLPTAIGRTTSAGSLSTVVASDDAMIGIVTETAPASDTASSGLNGRLQRIAQRLTTLITAIGTQVFGAGTSAAAQRVTIASDSPDVATLGATSGAKVITDANGTIQQYLRGLVYRPATGTESNVAGSATDVTILAANTSRLGFSVYNDSAAILYLLLSNTTSSATVHTIQIAPGGYFEKELGYTGAVKGIWASATGSARVTEFT